jgi:predicted GNAT family acetyltransferase
LVVSPPFTPGIVEYTVDHEEVDHRGAFFIEQDGARVAEMTYSRVNPSLVIIDHTEVAPSLGGQGVGRRLLDTAVQWARRTGTKVMATCPYASAQFAKDPSIRDVLA